jgi:hypothetical protein
MLVARQNDCDVRSLSCSVTVFMAASALGLGPRLNRRERGTAMGTAYSITTWFGLPIP